MKEKYYLLLHGLIEEIKPVTSVQFTISLIGEILFIGLIWLVQQVVTDQVMDASNTMILVASVHSIVFFLGFMLFLVNKQSKLLRLIPSLSFLVSQVELCFWSSLFWEDNQLIIFINFMIFHVLFLIITLIYQFAIIENVKDWPFELRINKLHLLMTVLILLSAMLAILTRFLNLHGKYMLLALLGVSSAMTQMNLLWYTQIWTGWRNK